MEDTTEIKLFFEAYETQAEVDAEVLEFTGKGFNVNVFGRKCYLPGSHQEKKMSPEESASMVGNTIKVTILKINPFKNNIVVSQKVHAERSKTEKAINAFDKLNIGDIVRGKVKAFVDYGVFVSLGDIDGLIMVKDLSYLRVSDPKEIVSIGQEIDVKVINLDNTKGYPRVSLSLKEMKEDPWSSAHRYIIVGQKLSCKIVNIPDYGVFLETPYGVTGLLHISVINVPRGSSLRNMFSKGQIVDVIVDTFDPQKHKLSFVLAK